MIESIGMKVTDAQCEAIVTMAEEQFDRFASMSPEDRDAASFAATVGIAGIMMVGLFNELQDIKKQIAEAEKKLVTKIAVGS